MNEMLDTFYFWFFFALSILLGASVGSFLNVLIYRVPREESLVKDASHCTVCGHKIRWYDNIPILSYIFLRGKCRDCKSKISPRYVIVETLNTLIWVGFALLSKRTGYVNAVLNMLFSSVCIVVAFTDYEHGFIPDRYNIALLVFGALATSFDKYVSWKSHLIGFGFALIFFLLLYGFARLVFKREGLGLGDVKFAAVSGLALGIKASFFGILIAGISAAIILPILVVKLKKDKRTEFPFGPFLAVGYIIAAFVGELVVTAYLNLFL